MALPVGNLSVLWDESVTGESTTIIAMQLQCIGSSEITTGYKLNCHDHHDQHCIGGTSVMHVNRRAAL